MYPERECRVMDLGLIDYPQALAHQRRIVSEVISGKAPDTLITCEHPHVITFSRRLNKKNILISSEELLKWGVGFYSADRGGDVTYHGPGQIVLYPIINLRKGMKDLHLYLRNLEQVVINVLRNHFGLNAYRKTGYTGVWVGPYKVASIGVAVRNWVSYHGLSLNVKADSRFFSWIRPCGMDIKMASINDFFDDEVSIETIRMMLVESVKEVFCYK